MSTSYDIGIEKDKVAIKELEVIIKRLQDILIICNLNIGKCRSIIPPSEIELIKDHLDLVIKYTRL